MQNIFLTLIDMSIVSSLVILAVLLVRALMKRAPRRFAYVLWAAVLLRLLCPFAVESPLSLIPEQAGELAQSAALPESENVSFVSAASAAYRAIGDAGGGQGAVRIEVGAPAPAQSGEQAEREYVSASRGQVWLLLCAWLWPAGTAAVLIWGVVGQIRLRRMLVGAVRLEGNVWLADHIPTAFVMGLARPKIFLPSGLEGPGRDYVLAHERAHVRRGDHITRLLAFAALALHWFNPLVWLAFAMSGRDMEMSCDEAVMRRCGADIRADYCQTLLDMSANKSFPSPCLLAFGEGDTGARVRNALRWKKPAFWVGIGAAVLIVVACVLLLTNPARKGGNTVEISFPAYQNGRDAARYDAAYDLTPFTMSVTLPKGWTAETPEELRVRTAGESGDLSADGCTLYTPVQLYDGKGAHAGFVGWSDYSPYEGDDVPEGDYYKTVYYSLRLGAHYGWEDFEALKGDEYTETHTATVYYQTPIENMDAAAWPQHTTPGVCHYDKRLGVYVAIQFDAGAATEKEILQMADSIALSVPVQESGLTEISFPGSYTDADGAERGSGTFTASMELPEGWTVRRRADGTHIPFTVMLESQMYLFDELGNTVGAVGYRAFDPDAEMPLIKRYAGMTDADYFRTRVFGELILGGDFRNGLEFVCGTDTSETSRSRDYGEWHNGDTGESSPYNLTFLCHYDTELNEYIVVTLDEEYITVRELDTLAKSISLRAGAPKSGGDQTVKVSFPGHYADVNRAGKIWDPGPFVASMKLPEGWSVRGGSSETPEGYNGEGYSPVYFRRDADDIFIGKITYYAFDPDNPAEAVNAGDGSEAENRRIGFCTELYTQRHWQDFESVAYTDTAETFRASILYTVYTDKTEIDTRYCIGRYDTELGVYVAIELRNGIVSESDAAMIAESLELEPVSISSNSAYFGFGGYDYSGGIRRGRGDFTVDMYLPEGWSTWRALDGGDPPDSENLPDTQGLPNPGYIYDENGKCVAFVAWAGFNPNAYADDTADRGLSAAVNATLANRTDWARRGWEQLDFSADGGTVYVSQIINSDGVDTGRRGICVYSRALEALVIVEFAEGREYDWAARLIAGSISLQGVPGFSSSSREQELIVPGYYSEDGVTVECRPFSASLTLPEGWTLRGAEEVPSSYHGCTLLPMAYMYDDAGNYAGFIGRQTHRGGTDTAGYKSGDEFLAYVKDINDNQVSSGMHYLWDIVTPKLTWPGGAITLAEVTYDIPAPEGSGRNWIGNSSQGICAIDTELETYFCVQFEPDAISEEEMIDMALSIKLDPGRVQYIPCFAGVDWGTDGRTMTEDFDSVFFGERTLSTSWSFLDRDCVAYYKFGPDGLLNGGYYSFNDTRTLTREEQIELYKQLLEELEDMYGEAGTPIYLEDLTPMGIQSVIDGKSDMATNSWTKRSPNGNGVDIYLSLHGDDITVSYSLLYER